MSAMPSPNDAGEDMVCDPCIPLPTVHGDTITQENDSNASNSAPSEREEVLLPRASCSDEFLDKYAALQTDFTQYALFLLNFCAECTIPDNVKFCLSTFVQFLQQQLEKITEAAGLELTKSKEAHEAERPQLSIDFEKKLNEVLLVSEAMIRREVIKCHLEEVSKCYSPSQCQLRCEQDTFQWKLQNYNKRVREMEVHQDEKVAKIPKKNMSQDVKKRDMISQKVDYLEMELHNSQEAAKASDQEVQHLRSIFHEEKEKAVKELKAETSQLKSKCQKLEAQLAQIEQKAARESLTSDAYAEEHANPSMLEEACNTVDKTTDDLIRFLHAVSITSSTSAKCKHQLEHFLGKISSASLANFSRPVQAKYAWGHWICCKMFDDFEHVFFDVDHGTMTSPLDPKIHALKCYESYQRNKHMASSKMYQGCKMFQSFCITKYLSLFHFDLVKMALHPHSADRNSRESNSGRFTGDNKIHRLFLDVAKAIWLLHELSFCFDPPASVLRMAAASAYDSQFHESVIHDSEDDGLPQVVLLMIRPAFRLRSTVIRSRVFLLTSGN